jgi:hypothetical protein
MDRLSVERDHLAFNFKESRQLAENLAKKLKGAHQAQVPSLSS